MRGAKTSKIYQVLVEDNGSVSGGGTITMDQAVCCPWCSVTSPCITQIDTKHRARHCPSLPGRVTPPSISWPAPPPRPLTQELPRAVSKISRIFHNIRRRPLLDTKGLLLFTFKNLLRQYDSERTLRTCQ